MNIVMQLQTAGAAYAIECRQIRESFPGVVALSDVSLPIRKSEIHGLLGQNRAGKSTPAKIFTGVYQPDAGEIIIDSKPVKMHVPSDAKANDVVIVYQDQQLIAQIDVTHNAFLGREITSVGWFLDMPTMRRAVKTALDRVGASFSPSTLVRDLNAARRRREQVAIAAALLRDPKVLVLDKPTASLSEAKTDLLCFSLVWALRNDSVTVVYILHYLNEVLNLVDCITVLRDGKLIETRDVTSVSRCNIVSMMVGRKVLQLLPKEEVPTAAPLLEVRDPKQGHAVHGVDTHPPRDCRANGRRGICRVTAAQ